MAVTREEVRKHGSAPWSDTLLWYARGVDVLQRRPITQKTSWRYIAAMHGFDAALWQRAGYLAAGEAVPAQGEQRRFWRQCQHQTWYFLPWHRSYLACLEAAVRDAIQSLGGPDDWALPYWNYSKGAASRAIPPAFKERRLPNGNEPNPLFVEARFGTGVDADTADLSRRLIDNDFVGVDSGSLQGFGGPRTRFSHSGLAEGLIEAAPHDLVHGDVGGRGGLMSDPRLAGLDPIFWLHHANIDRLWEVWRLRDSRNRNPTDAAWLDGPADRPFAMFGADGNDVPATPRHVVDTNALGYTYDDLTDPLRGADRRRLRLAAAGIADRSTRALGEEEHMTGRRNVELWGANDRAIPLGAHEASTEVRLAPEPGVRVAESFNRERSLADAGGAGASEPDRVFLNLENIRGNNGSARFDVYLRPKQSAGGVVADVPVGTFSLFGVEVASSPDGPSGGAGITKVLEVTEALDALQVNRSVPLDALEVRIVPRANVRDEDAITVGQVSFYRQGR